MSQPLYVSLLYYNPYTTTALVVLQKKIVSTNSRCFFPKNGLQCYRLPAVEESYIYSGVYLLNFFPIPFIIFALLFSLPPSRNSDPGSHSRVFSPPTPLRFVPCIFYREKISALSSLVDSRRCIVVILQKKSCKYMMTRHNQGYTSGLPARGARRPWCGPAPRAEGSVQPLARGERRAPGGPPEAFFLYIL